MNLKVVCGGMFAMGLSDIVLGLLLLAVYPSTGWLVLGVIKITLGVAWWIVAYLIYEKYNHKS